MAIKDLKKYIFENQKIEFVLEKIGCHHIKYHPNKEFYSCANFDGDNIGAVNVKNNEYLNVVNWTRTNDFGPNSDIITLTQYNKKCSFIDAVKYLYNILDLDYDPKAMRKKNNDKKFDPLAIFKNARCMRSILNVQDIQYIDENILNEYVPILHIDWFREGIMPWTMKKFGICYSYKHHRIVIPHRYWLTGKLLGANMRTTVQSYEELGIKKYFITPGMNKSINLYGLYENYDEIQKAGYVVVFEGEKSVLKNHSRDAHDSDKWKYSFNGKTCVALSGKTMSEEQIRILIGLNVEIIIALDKDVDINQTRYICDNFYNIRNVSYIYDKWGLLEDKQSPADANNKIYDFLFRYRIPYDSKEHEEYLKTKNCVQKI